MEKEIFAFYVIMFEPIKTCSAPQNDRLNFSFVKDIHAVGKKWLETVVKQTFSPAANFGHQALGLIDLPKSGWRGSLPSPGPPTVLLK